MYIEEIARSTGFERAFASFTLLNLRKVGGYMRANSPIKWCHKRDSNPPAFALSAHSLRARDDWKDE